MSTLPSPQGSPASCPTERLPATIDTSKVRADRGRPRRHHRRRVGRPTTLTPELAERLAAAVSQVGCLSTAARSCGVPRSLVCEWVSRGLGLDPDRRPTALFAEFADAVERARGEFEIERIRLTTAAARAPSNWRANAWLLERWDPARYGRRRLVDTSGMVPIGEVGPSSSRYSTRTLGSGALPRGRTRQPDRCGAADRWRRSRSVRRVGSTVAEGRRDPLPRGLFAAAASRRGSLGGLALSERLGVTADAGGRSRRR